MQVLEGRESLIAWDSKEECEGRGRGEILREERKMTASPPPLPNGRGS